MSFPSPFFRSGKGFSKVSEGYDTMKGKEMAL